MLSMLSNASNIQSCPIQNIPHIIGTYPNMKPRFNMLMQRIPCHCWMQWTNNGYRKSLEPFYFITMLKALGMMSTQQSKPTEATMTAIVKFLNYATMHSDAELEYSESNMILWIDSDASYLSESKAWSTCAGTFFLSDIPHDPSKPPQPQDPEPTPNAPDHVLCIIICENVSSAAEAELGGLFYDGKDAYQIWMCLEEKGTHNHQHLSKLTTLLLRELPMTQSNKNVQRLWYEMLLDSRSCPPGTIPYIFEKRWCESSWLFYWRSSYLTPPRNVTAIASPSQPCLSLFKLLWVSGHCWWWSWRTLCFYFYLSIICTIG